MSDNFLFFSPCFVKIDDISEVVRYYGQDLNKKGLQNALFRHINPMVKQLQIDADGTGTNFHEYLI